MLPGLALALASAQPKQPAAPSFNTDVRRILSGNCFKCHGPDDKQRTAGLRLDQRAGALGKLPSGNRAIVPGDTAKSELIRRIMATGPTQMPPATANKPLTAADKLVLKRWIASGAAYESHWAFVAPKRTAPPTVKLKGWPKNSIDHFTLARIEKAGLKPSPEADRYTLIRRVSLDLTGIPPTPKEVDAFVADSHPNAYGRVVDRLLTSPQYGERWARRWLDLARYADTNGYEKDRQRSVWPYRDWVINALNADLPFDQFTIEQIAGDLLPNATEAQKIATGFHRNTMLNEEGGIDPLEFRFHAMTDRVATTGTTWLGLTLGCAQCHTHKFDPITQVEYYRLMAYMNNADEPEMTLNRPEIAEARRKIEQEAALQEVALPSKFPGKSGAFDEGFSAWLKPLASSAVVWTPLRPVKATSNSPLLTVLDDNSVLSTGDVTKRDIYDISFKTDLKEITALRLEVIPDDRLPNNGPGRVFYEGPFGDFFLSDLTLSAAGQKVKFVKTSQTIGDAKGLIDEATHTGWSINGGQGKPNVAVLVLDKPLSAADLSIKMLFEQYYAASLGRFRISATTDARATFTAMLPDVETAVLKPATSRSHAESELVRQQFALAAPELKAAREEIGKKRATAPPSVTTLVFQERPANNPRQTILYHRGEYLQPKEQVKPGLPAAFPGLSPGSAANRLSFAKWLVSPQNPLTARVTANRQWAAFFGRGIVTTLEDFGYQGEPPTHPELLDWLANELVRQKWSMKRLHRLIVTSATYRQSSAVSPMLAAKDPQNRLFARAPRARLEAEVLRDSALAAAGLLSKKIGGPSVFPPQPPGVTTDGTFGGMAWKASEGEDRYRRGLYTFSKRTAPYASFVTFDAPTGEACVARREVSNTPLQALTLLNDGVFTEAAQALGRTAALSQGAAEDRAGHMFRRLLARPPIADELNKLVQFYASQRARFAAKEIDAGAVSGPGDGDPVERASWTALARALLNLDETITRR